MKPKLVGHVSLMEVTQALTEGGPFVIRQIDDDPDLTVYDLLFVDSGKIRYSDDVWGSLEDAQDALKVYSEASEKPTWWDEYTPK